MTTQIEDLEARLAGGRKVKPVWIAPVLGDFEPYVRVTAFDGSLNNAGWLRLFRTENGVTVSHRGTLRPKTELTGYRGTWERAIQLRIMLEQLDPAAAECDHAAVEAPMVAGGHRTESSLIAGLQVWQWAAHRVGTHKRLDVGATHVSAVLLGDSRVGQDERKAKIKAAVARYIPGSDSREWNEHERDAAAIALTVLWDLAHR